MEKSGVRIPPTPAALEMTRYLHRLCVAGWQPDVERAPVDVLAIFGDTEGGACQHRIGLARAISREHRRAGHPDGVHNTGDKIKNADIDRNLLARVVVAQELRKVCHRLRDRPSIV